MVAASEGYSLTERHTPCSSALRRRALLAYARFMLCSCQHRTVEQRSLREVHSCGVCRHCTTKRLACNTCKAARQYKGPRDAAQEFIIVVLVGIIITGAYVGETDRKQARARGVCVFLNYFMSSCKKERERGGRGGREGEKRGRGEGVRGYSMPRSVRDGDVAKMSMAEPHPGKLARAKQSSGACFLVLGNWHTRGSGPRHAWKHTSIPACTRFTTLGGCSGGVCERCEWRVCTVDAAMST